MTDILVLGATGNIGSELVKQLAAGGHDPILGVTSEVEGSPHRQRVLDFGDRASLQQAFEGVDSLFVVLPVAEATGTFADNIAAAATAAGVGHIVRSSAAAAETGSDYSLLALHGEIDDRFAKAGPTVTITRPSSFMQNYQRFLGPMIAGGTVYSATGSGRSAWIDVADIAAANAAVLTDPAPHAGKTYTLTGPEAFALPDGVAAIADGLDREIAVVDITSEQAHQTMLGFGMPEYEVDMIGSLEAAARDGVFEPVTTDIETLTGRPPRTFGEFVTANLDGWR